MATTKEIRISQLPLEKDIRDISTVGINSANKSVRVPIGEVINEEIRKVKRTFAYPKIDALTVGSSADDVATALTAEGENKPTMPNVGDILVDWSGVTRVPVVRQTVKTGVKPIYSFSFRTADNTATKTVTIQGYLYEPQSVVSVESVKDVTQQMIQARVSGYQKGHLAILSPDMLPTDEVRVYRKLRTIRNVNPKDPNYNPIDYDNCRRIVKRWCEVKWINEYLDPIGMSGGMPTMKQVNIKTVRHFKSGVDQYYEVLFNVEGSQEDLSAKDYFDKYYVCKETTSNGHKKYIRNGKYKRSIGYASRRRSASVWWGLQVYRDGKPITEIMPFKFTATMLNGNKDSVTSLTVI